MTGITAVDRLHVVDHPAPPGSPEWCRLVTASKVPAIVGESHYQSRYGVWCAMNGISVPPDHSMQDRFRTGHAMERALAWWWTDRHPEYRVSRDEVQLHNPGLNMPTVATLDRIATPVGRNRGPKTSRNIQFKTVGDYDDWSQLTDETLPAEWLIQVTWEMLVSGLTQHSTLIVAAGPYYDWEEFEVPFNPGLAAGLINRVRGFLGTLDGEPPVPAFPNDLKVARLRHPDVDPDAEPAVLIDELADSWVDGKREQKRLKADLRVLKKNLDVTTARLIESMGTSPEATNQNGFVVATRKVTKSGTIQTRFVDPTPKGKAA